MVDAGKVSEANEDQEDYWNSAAGQKWVTYQDGLDTVFENVTERLLARAYPAPAERVLEIGCGTGAIALQVAGRVGAEGAVLGADISNVLLGHAEKRKSDGRFENLDFLLADAQTHAFERGSFDLVLSRYGVMFFNDPVTAFRNLCAALRPGGRLSFVSWAPMTENPWFALPKSIAEARLGPMAPTPPRAPGPFAFAEADYVLDILRQAGFKETSTDTETIQLFHPGGLDAITPLASNLGASARIMKQYDGTAEDLAHITRETAKELAQYVTEDGIRIPARLHFFDAVKPASG